jgi:RNA polymerase sigma-70 factor, ECF subfamily
MDTSPETTGQALPPGSNLEACVAAVRAGEREAYRQVVELCEARVRIVLAAILPDSDGVDDLAQEVFVTAYGKLNEYRPGSDFVAWLKAIARGLALNERRRWFRQARMKGKFELEFETSLEPFVEAFSERYAGDVLDALRECLGRLEDLARGMIEDSYFQNLSSHEIARRRGREDGWVRLVLFRARLALAACLQSKGVS